ncbi:hypothetical protein PMN64_38690, partial [Bradyrhizobium sp. UFLA01-814]
MKINRGGAAITFIAGIVAGLSLLCGVVLGAEPIRKSGYAIGADRCGPFPRIQIDMQRGFCAGLVASEDDGLQFPRSIIQ